MSKTSRSILIGAIAVAVIGAALWRGISEIAPTPVFSPREELLALWADYKKSFIEPASGRSFDPADGYVTTSEAESYTMLRAAWMDDKATFDASWKWTKDDLQRPDKLISWLFGKKADGSYGILADQGGENSAADADTDIALALVFGAARWNDSQDYGDAIVMIHAIWDDEVVMIGGKPYLAADNVEKTSGGRYVTIDPSYFAPYAYRVFAKLDPDHPWMELVDTSYQVLGQSMSSPLDKASSAGLPPDWIMIDRTTGQILPPDSSPSAASTTVAASSSLAEAHTTAMGFDALRVPFRLELDLQWNGEPRAAELLGQMGFLASAWKKNGFLRTTYAHDGTPLASGESPAFYGGTIGYFMTADPADGKAVYARKLQSLFDADTSDWKTGLGYYDSNWAWFGIGEYNGLLANLSQLK